MAILLSILVIDDEASLGELYQNFLSKINAKVTFCDHPQKGWQKIDKEKFDLVITDLKMPIISGDEFISIVRASKFNAHTPVVLSSAYINNLVISEVSRSSKIYFLAKPFDSKTLLDLVEKAVGVIKVANGNEVIQSISEKWNLSITKKLSEVTGKVVDVKRIDNFELWNFESVSVHFAIYKDNEILNVTLLMQMKTFLKLAGKIQGTKYTDIENETLHVWQELLQKTISGIGKITYSKVISLEILKLPEINSEFCSYETQFGIVFAHLN